MGALHEGHLALVRHARSIADHVTVSIFVNPTQFGPGEDLDRYPRTLTKDLEMLAQVGGVQAVFAPSPEEMYPDSEATQGGLTWVEVQRMAERLCGRRRPGHFRGVTTVVAKLLNICKPHVAVFGRKDAQQFLMIRRMVADLNMDVEILGIPIVREADGLAMSSRNRYLRKEDRTQAKVLSQAVAVARERILGGEQRVEAIVEAMHVVLDQAPNARTQYVEIVDTDMLQPLEVLASGTEVLAAVAVYFGETRLIDNTFVRVP